MDVVDIVSPKIAHCEYTSYSLQHFKHVFIEKRICITGASFKTYKITTTQLKYAETHKTQMHFQC